ncbi:Zinc finger RING-type [Arabidopsis suecica]|uniref:Zinc finger RING-type n=1 Tax=Arabidopsis suecica TaxID=45249 RepID=A0A8T1XU05_ARASU|nr:Zinc finger RING-type [Arabidopsis suecica]
MFPEITIDVNVFPSPRKSASNTVEIYLKRERDDKCDDVPPFPITHLILNNIVNFDPHKTPSLLYSTFQDDFVRSRLCVEMALASERVPAPFDMYLHGTVRFIGSSSSSSTQDNETCAICLEDMSEDVQDFQEMPNCPHLFHDNCIYKWLIDNTLCPLCRTVIIEDDDDDNHSYYSETES